MTYKKLKFKIEKKNIEINMPRRKKQRNIKNTEI